MRAIFYARVSTDQQEANTSLDTQLAAGERYCADRGYDLVRTIRDSASAATLDRPGMNEARGMLRAHEADVVVAYAIDRLSRNQNHIGILFDDFQRHGAKLEIVTETFEDTAIGRFIVSARGFMAEVEREKIIERTSRGRVAKALTGSFVGPHPFGYDRVSKGVLAVNEEQGRIVRRIYDLFMENIGMRAIAIQLNAEGCRTRRGFLWTAKEVRDCLTNETYTGLMKYGGLRLAGIAPVIIEGEAWTRVQERLRRKSHLPAGRTQVSVNLLTGILHCGECGGRMIGVSRPTRRNGHVWLYRVYECLKYRRALGCVPNKHKADDLEARVVELLNESVGAVTPKLAEQRDDRLRTDLATIEKQIAENDTERRGVASSIARALFATDAQARAANRDVEDRRERLEAQKRSITDELESFRAAQERAQTMPMEIGRLVDATTSLPEKKRILQTYIHTATVWVGNPEPLVEA